MTEQQSELTSQPLAPADVTEWLRFHGWSQTARLGNLAARWESTDHGVVVPLLRSSSDFQLRWSEMFRELSVALDTDEAGIMLAIAKVGSDIAEFRVAGDGSIDDSIPLGDASTFIDSVRRATQASANSALQPRSYYGHSLPEAAREHARNVRMGQTRRGSYIVPVISRLPVPEPLDFEDVPLFDEAVYRPFARVAMLKLAEGLSVIQSLASEGSIPSRRQITESVGAGVSHELCDSVANTLDAESIDTLEASFSWAERLPIHRTPEKVTLDRAASEVIRQISDVLKGDIVVGQQTFVGYVKGLNRGEEDDTGRITLRVLDNDRARNIGMELGDEEYDRASHANNERKLISVTGVLRREPGRALRFTEVSDFELVDQLPQSS